MSRVQPDTAKVGWELYICVGSGLTFTTTNLLGKDFMKKHYSPKDIYLAQKMLRDKINSIPKKHKAKFSQDLLTLIDKAHDDDYESFNIE